MPSLVVRNRMVVRASYSGHSMDELNMDALTRQTAMNAKAESLVGWHLAAFCGRCRILAQIDIDRLPPAHAGRTVREIVARLRCSRCGQWPVSVTLADGHDGADHAERQRIELLP